MLETFGLSDNDLQEFYKVINSYKKYGNSVDKFLEVLPQILSKYKEELIIDNFSLLKGGRLGLVFSGYSNKHDKKLVLKFIPHFLDIYEIESNAYKRLSKFYMCPVYKIDDENNVIVMEKLDNEKILKYCDNKQDVENFFDTVYSNLTPTKKEDPIRYIEILNKYFEMLGNVEDISNWEHLKKAALSRYEENFKEDDLYLIHGDLHSKNIMKNSDGYHAIDPLGYVAPKEFMFARFIITELFFTSNSQVYFDELINFISKYANKEKLLNAVYIDSILFTSALLLQIENYQKILPKVMGIIDLISKNINVMEDKKDEENCYNIAKTRKLVFGG